MRRPELIKVYLSTNPEYFDYYSLDRFALGLAQRANFIQAEDLAIIFGKIKGINISQLIHFLGKLNEYKAIGPILNRIDYEGQSFLKVILGLPIEILGPNVTDPILKFQHYLAEAYGIANSLTEFGFMAATTKAKDMVSEILEENTPQSS